MALKHRTQPGLSRVPYNSSLALQVALNAFSRITLLLKILNHRDTEGTEARLTTLLRDARAS